LYHSNRFVPALWYPPEKQDETEIWVADNANNYPCIFDGAVMPPTLKTSVKVRDEPGWITFAINGKLASQWSEAVTTTPTILVPRTRTNAPRAGQATF
jgi:hypothetical protein